MNKRPSLRTGAWIAAFLLVIGVACWWVLRPGGNAAEEEDSAGPAKTRLKKRTTGPAEPGADISGENTLGVLYDKQNPFHKPTKEQLEPYLKSRHRSVASLLTAWQITGELEFVREAATKDAGDARVLLALAANESTPEAKRTALAAFRQAFPKNALGDYLLATVEHQAGNHDAALDAMHAATDKPGFDKPKPQLQSELEAAYRSAGLDPLVARALAVADESSKSGKLLFPISALLGGFRLQAQQDEDPDAPLEKAKMGLRLAERIRQGASMLDLMACVSLEAAVLRALPPETEIAPGGVTAAQRLADGMAARDEVKDLAANASQVATLSTQDACHYLDISHREGDLAALRWLKQTLEMPGQK